MKPRNAFLITSALMLCGLVSFAVLWFAGPDGRAGFPLDDAWIHLVYGRSVAEQGYLAYNSGIPATGSTSPLWAYALGLIHLLSSSPAFVVPAVKIAGILSHLMMAYLAYRIVFKFTHSSFWGSLSAFFLGLSPFLIAAGLSGMEISFGCALSLGGVWAYLNGRNGWAGLLLGLAGLTRPEYALVVCMLMADLIVRLWKGRAKFTDFVAFTAPIVACACTYVGWNLAVDGRPFPATYYVKSMPKGGMNLFDRTVFGFLIISGAAPLKGGLIWIALLGLLWTGQELRRTLLLLLSSGAVYFIGSLVLIPPFDPEAFYHIRYLLPSVPFLFISLSISGVAGLRVFRQRVREEKARSRAHLFSRTMAAVILISLSVYTLTGLKDWTTKFGRDCRNINEVQVELGRAVSRGFNDQARIGTTDAGAVRYFGRRFTLDLMELNSRIPRFPDCSKEFLDALVLMPAWVAVSEPKSLSTIAFRQTKDYQVTSNLRMNHQILVVSQCEPGQVFRELNMQLLGKPIRICLKCCDEVSIDHYREAVAMRNEKTPILEQRND